MLDHSRLVRIITLALASCAVTWALAGSALAVPDSKSNTQTTAAPAFKAVPGDTNKAPSSDQAPSFNPVVADANKTPDAAQVQRVRNGINNRTPQPAVDSTDDTGVIALVLAIAAMLVAFGAVTLTITRSRHPITTA